MRGVYFKARGEAGGIVSRMTCDVGCRWEAPPGGILPMSVTTVTVGCWWEAPLGGILPMSVTTVTVSPLYARAHEGILDCELQVVERWTARRLARGG